MVSSGRAEMTGALYYSDVNINQDTLKQYNGVWVNGFVSYSFHKNRHILQGVSVLTRKQAIQVLLTDNRQIDYYFDSQEEIIQVAQQLNIKQVLPYGLI